jgi:hypothetical protein
MNSANTIVSVTIHPAIGLARVGNSPDRLFFAPEIPGPHPGDPDDFRDAQGRIKRQAVRFRIYGLNSQGEVVREITADEGEITWTVHVANKKAAWFNFDTAFDTPAAQGQIVGVAPTVSTLRNAQVLSPERTQLVIDPGARTITGRDINGHGNDRTYTFDTGKFFDKSVYLGELRTDAAGRLVFLGGRGLSGSKGDVPVQPRQFANNDWWHDDTCDGPVEATVRFQDQEMQATGAWVIVAPPDYAPGIRALATGYDLAFEVAMQLQPDLKPERPSFSQQIYPLLTRLSDYQWVNAGFSLEFGWGTANDFTDPEMITRLNDPDEASRPLRQAIFARFRNAAYTQVQADSWPGIYGDGVTLNPKSTDPREWMAVLESQYAWLEQWAEGQFVPDGPPVNPTWHELSPAQQARALDRAALDEAIGGPFHPGAEFTWPLRAPMLYAAPFRVKRRSGQEPDWSPNLISQIALAIDGPLNGSGPGDLTRWMACPWQTDTASCLSAYRPFGGEYLPTFWPARVPNDVLSQENYQILLDPHATVEAKETAFGVTQRQQWLRGIVYSEHRTYPPVTITDPMPTQVFTTEWWKVGIVTRKTGPTDHALFPRQLWVETGRHLPSPTSAAGQTAAEAVTMETLWDHNPNRHR